LAALLSSAHLRCRQPHSVPQLPSRDRHVGSFAQELTQC
jgi:hypothetical protein